MEKISSPYVPPALKEGAVIGIAAPSGRVKYREKFEKGIRILHELGFQTKFPRNLWPGFDYLADSDQNRAAEFNRLWVDNDIDAIMAARGGYGCLRIAENLKEESVGKNPKLFIGFSDVTIIHNHVNTRKLCASLHGPVVTSLPHMTEDSLKQFHRTVHTGLTSWGFREKIEILRGIGVHTGVSCGGNLSTLLSMVGTPHETSWKGKIVFLEDNCESAYRIDRMFTQLKLCGKLAEPSAIILGDFSYGLNLDRVGVMRHHEFIWQRVCELTDDKVTVWGNFPIGHGSINYAVPFGVNLRLDNSNGTLVCSP